MSNQKRQDLEWFLGPAQAVLNGKSNFGDNGGGGHTVWMDREIWPIHHENGLDLISRFRRNRTAWETLSCEHRRWLVAVYAQDEYQTQTVMCRMPPFTGAAVLLAAKAVELEGRIKEYILSGGTKRLSGQERRRIEDKAGELLMCAHDAWVDALVGVDSR